MSEQKNGWFEWSRHVLSELERLSDGQESVKSEVSKLRVDIAMLKVKSGVWGLIGGAISVTVGLLIYFFKGIK